MKYGYIYKPYILNTKYTQDNIDKISIGIKIDPWLLYGVALGVYIVNDQLSLAAKSNQQ